MPSLNQCSFIGRLGRDPEMRYTPSGAPVTQFSLAVDHRYKDSSGEWQEAVEWVRCVAWGPLAERLAEYLRKGRLVYVSGRLQTREWEDQSGAKRYTTEVVLYQGFALDKRQEEDGDAPAPGPADRPSTSSGDDLGDLPF